MEILRTDDNFIDLIDIEEELLNPKWYTDLPSGEINDSKTCTHKPSKEYDILLEEVTPFVQFKDNVKTGYQKDQQEQKLIKKNTDQCKKKVKFAKHVLSVEKINHDLCHFKDPVQLAKSSSPDICVPFGKRCKFDCNTTSSSNNGTTEIQHAQLITPRKQETAQILNKLSNLGLQIKRSNPPQQIPQIADEKTKQILLKLQSKGSMKVKLINKQNGGGLSPTIPQPPTKSKEARKSQEILKPQFNNVVIRKMD